MSKEDSEKFILEVKLSDDEIQFYDIISDDFSSVKRNVERS